MSHIPFFLFHNYCLCIHSLFDHLQLDLEYEACTAKKGEFNCFIRSGEPEMCARKIIKCYLSLRRQRKCVSDTYKKAPGRAGCWGGWHVQLLRKLAASGKKSALEEIKNCIWMPRTSVKTNIRPQAHCFAERYKFPWVKKGSFKVEINVFH